MAVGSTAHASAEGGKHDMGVCSAILCSLLIVARTCGSPPVRLLLGSHAVDTMRDKLRHSIEEIENWRAISSLEQL